MATCTGPPLLTLLLVTEALRGPAIRPLRPVTVNCVGVAVVTQTIAPLLKVTRLPASTVEKPQPRGMRVVAFTATTVVAAVTTGATVAACTGLPLLTPGPVCQYMYGIEPLAGGS